MRVGILGSGLMGGKLGTIFARAGQEVIFSYARSQEKLKRLAQGAKGSTKLIDATNGRRTRAMIVTEGDHLILSSLEPATLAQRLADDRGPAE